jgi:hypothetical protein
MPASDGEPSRASIHQTSTPSKNMTNKHPMKISICILTTLAALAIAEPASAGDHVWYGGGGNSFWSNPANWQNNDPPLVGEAAPVGVYVRQANAVSTFDLDGLAAIR